MHTKAKAHNQMHSRHKRTRADQQEQTPLICISDILIAAVHVTADDHLQLIMMIGMDFATLVFIIYTSTYRYTHFLTSHM